MPGLTVTEKAHWKDRISNRIDKNIDAIFAEDANLNERVQRDARARARALASLNLTELETELTRIEEEEEKLEKRKENLNKEMLAKVRGVAVDDLNDNSFGRYYSARYSNEVEQAIERRTKVHADELLAEDQLGRRILQLREERDNLLDSVWLATSPKQIKLFWEKVAELLGDKQTQLERDALAIEPVCDG